MAESTSYKDLLPIPAEDSHIKDQKLEYHDLMAQPTDSHALATSEQEEKGAAQEDHQLPIADLGWNEPESKIERPLVGGIDNEELWILVRRFNKQIYHVKEYPYPVPGGLDLNIAEDEEFSPDKLRSNIERLYLTIIIGLMSFVKHIARLRSWRETRRTAWFCTAYFVAWIFDFIVPLFATTLIVLIVYPPSREFLFPPAPIALVDSKSGGVQKPKAGVLGSHDSATGAPENHKGEAVEQEASNFVNGIASVAISSAAGKHPQKEDEGIDPAHSAVPDPTAIAIGAADAKDKAKGTLPSAKHDKTKVPVETAMWSKMRPAMRALADMTDGWERFANALSPTPPFPRDRHRLRLAALIVPLLGVSLVTSSYMFIKGTTFGIGFGFFGDPIIQPGLSLLNRKFPNWQKLLEIRNTILKGVPTNAQLTITLLRMGEANKAPLPPPPRVNEPPPEVPAEVTDEHLRTTGADPPLNATAAELDEAMSHDPTTAHETAGEDIDASKNAKHGKTGKRILGFFKGTTKAAVETVIGADKLKAKTGSSHAKNRLGAVPPKGEVPVAGPVEFKGRHHGHRGHVYITMVNLIPTVAFTRDKSVDKHGTLERDDEFKTEWSVPISEIAELKKVGGYGWKAKLVVGWALESEVREGLEIVDKQGNSWKVTAMSLRDELFNRLISMDTAAKRWEAY